MHKFHENANGDVPGVGNKKGEYMTVNLSLIVGHIRKLDGAVLKGVSCCGWYELDVHG